MNRGYALQYDEQIISYGIKYVLQVIKTLVIAIAIGSVTQKIMNTGLYVYFFIKLRKKCGGYHAPTQEICCTLFGIFLFITILGDGIFLDVHKIIIIVSAFVVYLKLSYEVPCGTIQNPIPNGVKVIMAKELKHYCQIGIFLLGGVSILNIDMGYFAACGVIVCGVLFGIGKQRENEKRYNK